MNYAKQRYLTYAVFTIFTLVVPFITINGNHLLLLSFDKFEFHFLGVSYSMNELFIMPFLLMILFIGIFAMTAIFGRVWCGWACPQTIFRVIYRDLIETFVLKLRRIKNKQKDIDYNKNSNKIRKYISLILWGILSLIIATNFMWYFVPPEDFFKYIQEPKEHPVLIMFVISIAVFLIYDIVFMKENFCTYVCPYSRIQSALYDDDTKQVVYNTNRGGNIYQNGEKSIFDIKQFSANEECTTCEACVKICPTHIDIRKGLQVECINCLECSDACATVMGKLGKKSLIYWGSTNSVLKNRISKLLSKRNLFYMASLIVCFLFTTYYITEKEPFLLNVNRTTNLYKVDSKGNTLNNYLLTIQNKSKEKYTYELKVLSEGFYLKRFRPLKLESQKREKSVLIVGISKNKLKTLNKDSIKKIKVQVYAKEDMRVSMIKELAFIYNKNEI
ncbi:MAG: cytochrome c oxidase accessory protein CcoG [Halarcobacter sp.]